MGGFFSFQRLFSADFIRLLYFAGMIVITLSGIFMILGMAKGLGFDIPVVARIPEKVQGAFLLVLGNLVWRILCEGWIVLFVIHEKLADIESNTRRWRQ
jgi:hypothetical protein